MVLTKRERELKVIAKWDKIREDKKKAKKKSRGKKWRKQRKKQVQSYKEYLLSDKWKKKRARILKQRNFKCEKCQSTINLQVHHLTYKNIFHEKDEDLQLLYAIKRYIK